VSEDLIQILTISDRNQERAYAISLKVDAAADIQSKLDDMFKDPNYLSGVIFSLLSVVLSLYHNSVSFHILFLEVYENVLK
jgi:hypothetical protein